MTNKKPIPKSQVRKTPHGWQVYAAGPKGHIAQGQPHKDLGAAQRDAKKFEDVERLMKQMLRKLKQKRRKHYLNLVSIGSQLRDKIEILKH